VNNVDEWIIAHLKFDPSQNFVRLECLKVFINGNQALIDIIVSAELAWYRNEIVYEYKMLRKHSRLLLLGE
jgi:hypothetical protein